MTDDDSVRIGLGAPGEIDPDDLIVNREVIEISLTPQLAAYIDRMVELGLWGDTREEVCVTLIREGIRRNWSLIHPGAPDLE